MWAPPNFFVTASGKEGVILLPGGRPAVALWVAAWRCFPCGSKNHGRRARKNGLRVNCHWQCGCEVKAHALRRRGDGGRLLSGPAVRQWEWRSHWCRAWGGRWGCCPPSCPSGARSGGGCAAGRCRGRRRGVREAARGRRGGPRRMWRATAPGAGSLAAPCLQQGCAWEVKYNCSLIRVDWLDACIALRVVGAVLVVLSGVGVKFAQSSRSIFRQKWSPIWTAFCKRDKACN